MQVTFSYWLSVTCLVTTFFPCFDKFICSLLLLLFSHTCYWQKPGHLVMQMGCSSQLAISSYQLYYLAVMP